MTKTVIAIYGVANHGKTTTIRVVAEEIFKRHQCVHEKDSPDTKSIEEVYALFRIKNVAIGIESTGDPKSRLFESLPKFVREKCDIIITACRTSGPTRDEVDALEKNHGYRIIWIKDPLYEEGNQNIRISLSNCHYFANYILDMFEDMLIGKL